MKRNQRVGSKSNAHVGREFEELAKHFLEKELNCDLEFGTKLKLGTNSKRRKEHKFDLGNLKKGIIVECKSHTWTTGDNVPSAKLSNWNKEMYFFYMMELQKRYKPFRKIFFIQRSYSVKRGITLGRYYREKHGFMIPNGVEIWEYDTDTGNCEITRVQ